MPKPIRSYRPEIQVLIDGYNLTDFLGDGGSVRVSKNLYAPTAEFQIAFPDRPTAWRDSLYGEISVMSTVEIKMRRWVDGAPALPPWTHVLRGFVRSVGRDEQVDRDGRVQRQVVLGGHDCGAALIMQQINPYISWQNAGVPYPAPLIFLRELGLTSQPYDAATFIWLVALTASESILSARKRDDDAAAFALQPVLSVKKGFVWPHTALSVDGPVWEMLRRYSDPPWNELFVREGVDGPELVFRPTPWMDIDGNPLPDADLGAVAVHEVSISDVVSLSAHRDDAELVNHAWVMAPWAGASANVQPLRSGRGLLNAETRATFGDRIQVAQTMLGPKESPISLPEGEQLRSQGLWGDWILERLRWITLAGEETHRFERGRLTLKGNPKIRVGDYVTVHRPAFDWQGYVVAVTHDYAPFRAYHTTVDYIRGDQWVRRQSVKNPWDRERMTSI